MKTDNLEFLVTLWPTFPHFERFAQDKRLSGIRLNSAMIRVAEMDKELAIANSIKNPVPLYFDVKGRQLRVTEVFPYKSHLELKLNHPIRVKTPTIVLFKAGADHALLEEVKDGNHLIFNDGPKYMVYEGESLHIREPSLEVNGPLFLDFEIEKIKKAREAGFNRFFLSYVEKQRDIDEFRDHVGDSYIIAKIENKNGLMYLASEFKKHENLGIMAARGDLYVEIEKPHQMAKIMRFIIGKDPEAYVGSRLLLSLVESPVPSCADISDLAWLYDLGYRKMMLCDELCLKEELMARAVNVFDAFKNSYAQQNKRAEKPSIKKYATKLIKTA